MNLGRSLYLSVPQFLTPKLRVMTNKIKCETQINWSELTANNNTSRLTVITKPEQLPLFHLFYDRRRMQTPAMSLGLPWHGHQLSWSLWVYTVLYSLERYKHLLQNRWLMVNARVSCPFLAVWPWGSDLPSLCLVFLLSKMGIIISCFVWRSKLMCVC